MRAPARLPSPQGRAWDDVVAAVQDEAQVEGVGAPPKPSATRCWEWVLVPT